MKADFPADDELEGEVKRQANKWETLSFTKKSKMIDLGQKLSRTKNQKWQTSVTINDKNNPQLATETPASTTNTAPAPAQEEVKQKVSIEDDILVC